MKRILFVGLLAFSSNLLSGCSCDVDWITTPYGTLPTGGCYYK
ncbi:MAG TPA: hypothetical protein VFM46_14195 [Pseudomonadales bacterium]|nr:hypothetical protein [Pseudomonadales bacterium]